MVDRNTVHWLGLTDDRGGVRLAGNNRYLTVGRLDPDGVLLRDWYIQRNEDSSGRARWERESAVGVMRRREVPDQVSPNRLYFLFRPSLTDEHTVDIPIYDRWPYPAEACGVSHQQAVPTPTRLWFFRGTQCPADPEYLTDVLVRLHGFDETGAEITPSEGLPLRGRVIWYASLTSTMQPMAADGVSYVIIDSGPSGLEPRALHWEHRDAWGELVARSDSFASADDVESTDHIWSAKTDDDAYLFYLHVTGAARAAVFARIEADGEIAWLHRFEGQDASTALNGSRVQALDGGVVALLSRRGLVDRSVVRIDRDGTLQIEPGELPVGDEAVFQAALSADAWGFTIGSYDVEDAEELQVSRYAWTDPTPTWTVALDRNTENSNLVTRADGHGGTFFFEMSSVADTYFQHLDAFGRPGAFQRAYFPCPGLTLEIHREDRPPIDAGIDAAPMPDAPRDAWRDDRERLDTDFFLDIDAR